MYIFVMHEWRPPNNRFIIKVYLLFKVVTNIEKNITSSLKQPNGNIKIIIIIILTLTGNYTCQLISNVMDVSVTSNVMIT